MNDWTIGHDENPAPETELIHYADQTAPAQIYRAAFFHEDSAEIPTVLETGRSKRPPGRLFLFPHPRLRTPPGSTNEVREMMRHHGIDTRSGVVPDDCKAVPLAMTGSPQVQIVHAEPRDATGVFIPDEPTDPGQLDAMLRELGTHLNGGDNGVLRWFHAESCPDCRSYRWRLHSESTRLNLSDFRESVEPARPSMLDAACSVAAAAGHNPSRASRRWFTSKTFLHTVEGRRTRSARTVYETTGQETRSPYRHRQQRQCQPAYARRPERPCCRRRTAVRRARAPRSNQRSSEQGRRRDPVRATERE